MKLDADVVVHVKGGIAIVMKLKQGMTAIVIDEDEGTAHMKRGRGLTGDRARQTDEEKVSADTKRSIAVTRFLDSLDGDGI